MTPNQRECVRLWNLAAIYERLAFFYMPGSVQRNARLAVAQHYQNQAEALIQLENPNG